MKRIITAVLITTLVIVGLLGSHYIYRYLRRQQTHRLLKPLPHQEPYLHQLPDYAPQQKYHAGDEIWLHLESERAAPCNVVTSSRIIKETLVNGVQYRIVYTSFNASRAHINAGKFVMEIRIALPAWLPPGDYMIDRFGDYRCENLLFQRTNRIPFSIVP